MKKQLTTYIVIVILAIGVIAGGFFAYQSFTAKPKETPVVARVCNATNSGKTITYNGAKDATALSLLQKDCDIETSGTGESAFVTSINGTKANSTNEFWSFKVNGEMASVGAGSYITKDGDTITWELSSF